MQNSIPTPSTLVAWQVCEEYETLFAKAGFEVASAIDLSFLDKSSSDDNLHQTNWLSSDLQRLEQWILKNAHGTMNFMDRNKDARKNPGLILPETQSAIVFLVPYSTGRKYRQARGSSLPAPSSDEVPLEKELPNPALFCNNTARYARGKDYHAVIKHKLFSAAQEFSKLLGSECGSTPSFRIVVDSVPLFDRAFARESGLGFVGKNTMFIRPGMGSYFFICTLLVSANCKSYARPLKHNAVSRLSCGTCTKCIDACPTQALSPYFLDSNRCLSYLTIENRSTIPSQFLHGLTTTAYGCDICQEVCPYNFTTGFSTIFEELATGPLQKFAVSILDVAQMDQQSYEKWFGGTALTRAKYGGLVRNALVHLHAIASPLLPEILKTRANDSNSLVAETVLQLSKLQTFQSKNPGN